MRFPPGMRLEGFAGMEGDKAWERERRSVWGIGSWRDSWFEAVKRVADVEVAMRNVSRWRTRARGQE